MKYKIVIISLIVGLLPTVTFAEKLCDNKKYSIIFINGMLNTKDDYEISKYALKRTLEISGIDTNPGSDIALRGAFNPKHLAGLGDSLKVLLQKGLDQINTVSGLDYDAKEMLSSMSSEVREGRILFVPHSQGNFYANTFYGWIASQKNGLPHQSMSMYNVASPAKFTAYNSKYILSKSDKIISGLVGSVGLIAEPNVNYKPDNSDPNGHNFIDTYLKYGGDKMAKDIKEQLKLLKIDKDRNEDIPCIPAPEIGPLHKVATQIYTILDPISNGVVSLTEGIVKITKNSIASIGNIIEKKDNEIVSKDADKKENIITSSSSENNNIEEQKIASYQNTITEISEEEKIKLYEERLEQIKGLLKEAEIENSNSQKEQPRENSTSGNHSYIVVEIKSTTTASSTQESNNNSTPTASSTQATEDNSTSTSDGVEDIFKKEKLTEFDIVSPLQNNVPKVVISEYYLSMNREEATWIEVKNTSKDKYVDMRNVLLEEKDFSIPFPVNAIPPGKIVILKDNAKLIHEYSSSSKLYKEYSILENKWRTDSYFSLKDKNTNEYISKTGINFYDCGSTYIHRYKRSCELISSNAWAYATNPEGGDRTIASSIGSDNYSDRYLCEETYLSSDAEGEDRRYVLGSCNVDSYNFPNLKDTSKWIFAPSDKVYFGGVGKSKIAVGGKIYFAEGDVRPRFSVKILENKYFFPDDIGPVFPYIKEDGTTSTEKIGYDTDGCFNGNFEDAKQIYELYSTCGNGWKKVSNNGWLVENRDELRTPEDGRLKLQFLKISNNGDNEIIIYNTSKAKLFCNNIAVEIEGKKWFYGCGIMKYSATFKIKENLPRVGTIKLLYSNNIFEPPRVIDSYKYDLDTIGNDLEMIDGQYYKIKTMKMDGSDPDDGYINW